MFSSKSFTSYICIFGPSWGNFFNVTWDTCGHPLVPAWLLEETILSSLNDLDTFGEKELTIMCELNLQADSSPSEPP